MVNLSQSLAAFLFGIEWLGSATPSAGGDDEMLHVPACAKA